MKRHYPYLLASNVLILSTSGPTKCPLTRPENKGKLTAILTYHVVPGKVMAAEVVGMDAAGTVQGAKVAIAAEGGSVQVNDANVTATDIECVNGVIHVIDAVLLPPSE